MKLRLWNYYWNASFPNACCFSRSIFLSLITVIVSDLIIMHALPQPFFWKNMNWKENSRIQRLVARFCHHDHMYLSRVFTGAARRAEYRTTWAGASELGAVALTVGLFEKCWQCFYSDHISIWIQLWCQGTMNNAKVRRQRAFYRDGLQSAG